MVWARLSRAAFLTVFASVVAISCAAAEREKAKDEAVLKGKIGTLDSEKRTITLVITKFDRKANESTETEKVLTVAKDAVLLQDGVKTKFENLKRGWPTTVTVEKQNAVSIAVDGPSVRGKYKSFNSERNTITVIAGRDMGEKIYHLLKTTKVATADNKAAKVEDLKAGAEIVLTLSVEGDNTVVRIDPALVEKKKRGE